MTENIQPPIDHWSHSSMGMILRNPLAFKKKYMLKIYDAEWSPSGVVGQGAHKAVEVFLKTGMENVEHAIEEGMKVLDSYSDLTINYGKTGSREKMLKDYTKAVNHYFNEMPDWQNREILMIEERVTEVIHDEEGREMPLPAKCIVDVVWRSTREEVFAGQTYPKGTLFIEDHKFVSSYTNHDDITDPNKIRQSFFNFLILREKLGEEPTAILFRETKISENRNGDAQSQYYVINFDDVRSELTAFFQLYIDCTKMVMNPDTIYLPNTSDMFDGNDAWLSYRDNLITADAPKVIHKTKEETKVVEVAYHESAPSKVENRNVDPEEKIRLKLQEFGIAVKMDETYRNGSVIMYTMKPSRGVRMSKIKQHEDDIAIALEAESIRVLAPIMGTDKVGIEVPNNNREIIPFMKDGVIRDDIGLEQDTMNIPIGIDAYGKTIIKDLADMPHLLIAGSTGSGKSVMLNVVLRAILHQNTPEKVKMVLIDPKKVEFRPFKNEPHLMTDVITETDRAMKALKWIVDEMEYRYDRMDEKGYKNIDEWNYNESEQLPKIVVVVDEFADLMLEMKDGYEEHQMCRTHIDWADREGLNADKLLRTKTKRRKEEQLWYEDVMDCSQCQTIQYPPIEKLIVRLAQKARAAGIHLIIATQRPSVDVVTGLIKANIATRIAFMVTSKVDSQIVLDQAGAEQLVGKGDMLFLDPSKRGLQRLQGYFID